MTVTRLTGGLAPGDGGDPRTFPAIWNATADVIDAQGTAVSDLEDLNPVQFGTAVGSAVANELLQYDGSDWVNVGQAEAGAIAVFAGTAARGSAIPSPSEGMVTYRSDDDVVEVFDGSAFAPVGGKILQLANVVKTDTFSTASVSLTDLTGLSIAITPRFSTSKIQCFLTIGIVDNSALALCYGDVTRNGTPIGIGDSGGTRQVGWLHTTAAANRGSSIAWSFLDTPATTSTLTYQARVGTGNNTLYINRQDTDQNRSIATLTVMEVAA